MRLGGGKRGSGKGSGSKDGQFRKRSRPNILDGAATEKEQTMEQKKLDELTQSVMKCANAHLSTYAKLGPNFEDEKVQASKLYHQMIADVAKGKLRCSMNKDAVSKVYDELDFSRLADKAEDDQLFMKILDDFGTAAVSRAETEWKKATLEAVGHDAVYKSCLEQLRELVDDYRDNFMAEGILEERKDPGDESETAVGSVDLGSSDIQIARDLIPTRDPITMKPLKRPCVNRICGHVYELGTIKEMTLKGGMMCPYPNCENVKVMDEGDLQMNHETRKKIEERIAFEESDESA